ncbi:MAG TPA: CHAT domain-containing tetratricopeptide repeat protein [Candidatus Acidoferrales bacterium]|nr:CHAT domain-containing tetratricopeptide repeat protein [Candidatus Acidoferrales bacterium]
MGQALQEADAQYRRYLGHDAEWAWRFRALEAQLLVAQGKPQSALDLLNENPPATLSTTDVPARRKMVLGLANGFSQRFDQAENDLSDAERLADPAYPELLAETLLSHGIVEMDEAQYSQADIFFHRALTIARDKSLLSVQSKALGSLGNVAMWQEHYDEAIDWYRTSLQVSSAAGVNDASAITLGNMGWNYFSLGDFESALIYFKRADEASAQSGLPGDQVQWETNLGNVYFEQHNYASAESSYRQALVLARKLDDRSATAECLDDLALVRLRQSQVDSAREFSDQVVQLMQGSQDHYLVPYSILVEGQVNAATKDYARAERLFQEVIGDSNAGRWQRWEAQAYLADVYASEGKQPEANAQFQESLATIESARTSVKTEEFRLSFLSSAIAVYGDYIDFLVGEGKVNDALQVAELSRARTLADGLGFSSAALSFPMRGFQPTKTAKTLNSTILSYWLGAKHSYVWVIDAAQVRLISLPPAAEIDSLVASYRQALTGPRDVLETRNVAGQGLFQLLVAPALGKLKGGSRVIVIPDGSLYGLNFEALLVPTPDLHYWIDDAVVSNANSLALLGASAAAKASGPRKLLLVGNPIPSSGDFPKLPQAESEMKQVESYFPGANSTVYANASATPEAYLNSHPDQFSFIHFVAHGTASLISPLDSAVILTKQGDSYKLYARDIIKQPLRAELVTISACHGAGERNYSGEGLVGLTWAFLRAGAHEVISALWEVDDNSTPQLMNRLYAGLSKGASPETALRDAKLALVHSDSIYKKPFYWAPFQIYRGL